MTDAITDIEDLEGHIGAASDVALAIMRDRLDTYQRQFIEQSPFICIATSDAENQPTVSPKGDAPGFVRVVDDQTLLLPDRIGNNKVESFHNLIANPKMGLIFMVPGLRETLRVSGEATITTDQALLKPSQVGANPVKTGLLISISRVYFHCGKALIRSKLWNETTKVPQSEFPSFAKIVKDQAQLSQDLEQMDAMVKDQYEQQLY